MNKDNYKRVAPTADELAEWRKRNPARAATALQNRKAPPVYRVQCLRCGARIWGSGLGIGSHDRSCGKRRADVVHAEYIATLPQALIGPTGYGSYGIVWRNAPALEARGGYSGPFDSHAQAAERAVDIALHFEGELPNIVEVENVNKLAIVLRPNDLSIAP